MEKLGNIVPLCPRCIETTKEYKGGYTCPICGLRIGIDEGRENDEQTRVGESGSRKDRSPN